MLYLTDSEFHQAIKDYTTIMIFGANEGGQKREIFREYYEWAFHILEGPEKMYPDAVSESERFLGL